MPWANDPAIEDSVVTIPEVSAEEGVRSFRRLRLQSELAETKAVGERIAANLANLEAEEARKQAAEARQADVMSAFRADVQQDLAGAEAELRRVHGPMDVLAEPIIRSAGALANYLGNVAGGAARDLLTGEPGLKNFDEALLGKPPVTPEPTSLVNQGLEAAARGTGPLVVGAALQAMGVPAPVAFGGAMGAATHAAGGTPIEVAKSAAIGALLPGTAAAGRQAAAWGLGEAVKRGMLSGDDIVKQKAVEFLAEQVPMQAFMEGMNLDYYRNLPPRTESPGFGPQPDRQHEPGGAIAAASAARTQCYAGGVAGRCPGVRGAEPNDGRSGGHGGISAARG